jgi:hypothetical protein
MFHSWTLWRKLISKNDWVYLFFKFIEQKWQLKIIHRYKSFFLLNEIYVLFLGLREFTCVMESESFMRNTNEHNLVARWETFIVHCMDFFNYRIIDPSYRLFKIREKKYWKSFDHIDIKYWHGFWYFIHIMSVNEWYIVYRKWRDNSQNLVSISLILFRKEGDIKVWSPPFNIWHSNSKQPTRNRKKIS